MCLFANCPFSLVKCSNHFLLILGGWVVCYCCLLRFFYIFCIVVLYQIHVFANIFFQFVVCLFILIAISSISFLSVYLCTIQVLFWLALSCYDIWGWSPTTFCSFRVFLCPFSGFVAHVNISINLNVVLKHYMYCYLDYITLLIYFRETNVVMILSVAVS